MVTFKLPNVEFERTPQLLQISIDVKYITYTKPCHYIRKDHVKIFL